MAERSTPRHSESRAVSTGPPRMTPLREVQLVEAHRNGDPEALGELLQAYQRRVYTICYRMLRNSDEAGDLTQDTLVKLLENLDKYDGRAKLSTWVIRITINCCLSYLRRKKVRRHGTLDGDGLAGHAGDTTFSGSEALFDSELSAPQRVEREEMQSMLHKAMLSLEPDMRAVLVLRDMQGLEYEQMAEALEVPVGTIKSRLFRARVALRSEMERYSS